MDLIERYIYAVTKNMPTDQRDDVADELRDIIQVSLDEKGSQSKKDVKEVLTALGDPAILAQRYKGGAQYLIGPTLYPTYVRAMKLTFAIGIPIALFAAVISQIIQNPESITGFISSVISILIGAILHMLFWVTLVFFILERSNVTEKDLVGEAWTPDMLPQVQTDRQIPTSEAIADIVWYSFIALLPVLAQPLLGAHLNGQTTPFFNQDIGTAWSIAAVVLGLVGIVKSILKLRIKKWTAGLATFNVIYAVVFSGVLIALPFMAQIVNPAFITLLDTHINTADLAQVKNGIAWTIGISIAVTVGIYLYDAFNSIRLSRKLSKQ